MTQLQQHPQALAALVDAALDQRYPSPELQAALQQYLTLTPQKEAT